MSPTLTSVTRPRSGGSVADTNEADWHCCSTTSPAAAALSGFPPLQRAQLVQLACLEPVAQGLHITHWSSADLARQAVVRGIVEAISPATVRRIIGSVDLQPHRTRYWRTARLDGRFKQRAEKVLWCYANAARLARQGISVVCADEMPNLQVLERQPIRRAVVGSIEQREFEYAFEVLEKLCPKGSLEPLVAALASSHTDVRIGVLERLSGFRDPRVTSALLRALSSDHEDLRLRAAELLADEKDDRSVDVLVAALRADDEKTASRARAALSRLASDRAVAALAARLEEKVCWKPIGWSSSALSARAEQNPRSIRSQLDSMLTSLAPNREAALRSGCRRSEFERAPRFPFSRVDRPARAASRRSATTR